MMSAVTGAWLAAALLAMVGAIFGVCFARMIWAEDLKHAQELRQIWNKTQASLESIIKSQEERLKIYERR